MRFSRGTIEMHRRAMIPAGEIPLMGDGNQNSSPESDETPLIIHRNPNFRRPIPSSSLCQAISKDAELPSAAVDASDPRNPEAQPENEQPLEGSSRKKQRCHRHTTHQIHGMEEFFKLNSHPSEEQRTKIGIQLGLEPSQVKSWFQNKRTQVKAQQEREKNCHLGLENVRLRDENSWLKRQMAIAACKKCRNSCVNIMPTKDEKQRPLRSDNDEEQQRLRSDNARLKEEIDRLTGDIKHTLSNNGKPSTFPLPLDQFGTPQFGRTTFGGQEADSITFRHLGYLSEQDKSFLTQYAVFALDELSIMAGVGEPLWMPDPLRNIHVLNEREYLKRFGRGIEAGRIGSYKFEASRECDIVMMSPLNIVQIFMELTKWLVMFSSMVTRAKLFEVLSLGSARNCSGAMQLISAEFRALAPVVRERDCEFLRHCKKLNEQTWIVVDFSVEDILSRLPMATCHRRPSGCIIEGMPNGFSKITWVEHVEVQEQGTHSLTSSIIRSGSAFGAKRWISILKRQCERLACARVTGNHPFREDINEIEMKHSEGREKLMRLAERMVMNFYGGVTATPAAYLWTPVSGNGVDRVRIMSRKGKDDPGRPVGFVLSASLCFWMPVGSQTLLNYLRCHSTRAEWDILSTGGVVREISRISNGQEAGNDITILGVMNRRADPSNIMILQESNTEPTASFLVYAPVDPSQTGILFGCGNPENLRLLPYGFTILPSGPPGYDGGNTEYAVINGSLLTIAFQLLVDTDPPAMVSDKSIASVEDIIKTTAQKIKTVFRVL